jgi:DDE superfamily endonuclease/Tc5 transposase DNA-binding domain
LIKIRRGQGVRERRRDAEQPLLEEALFEWHQRLQNSRIPITGDLIRAAATQLWNRIPTLAELPEPKWSIGWLEGFKSRNGIRKRKQHGEAASVNMEGAEDRMIELRAIVAPYPSKDVYNMDETGLFWKATPDTTLATESQSGTKKQKARISLANCSNADGSDKIPLWIIGVSKRPRCFARARINISSLNAHWRYNKKAWMTTVIMLEWLTWFDKRMQNRKVLLLIDGFSAHQAAVRTVLENRSLKNTRVEFLPPNCTSVYQPLDQGIIANFKALYRRYWLQFMVEHSLENRDPIKQMHVLWAI